MLRYIKTNGTWIDTLSALRDSHIIYIVIDNLVLNAETDEIIGPVEEESDSYDGPVMEHKEKREEFDLDIWN